ncbi:MAG TPA: DNA methyltransferase [Sedimentisphaerales bacterium]|nr:DNA methyltransferase [Sedimentisphaerales bacterium]
MGVKVDQKGAGLLFSDPGTQSSDRRLFVNKAKLLEVIGDLKQEVSLSRLRNGIVGLESNLRSVKTDKIGLLNIDGNGDTVEIAHRHLLDQLNQVAEAHTVERATYYLERLEKAMTEVRTSKINDINLNRWKEYEDIRTDSLWIIGKRDGTGVHSAGYWGNFIPQIPNQMIRRYTKKGEWVLDTFVGCGTTLIESQRLSRNAIGIELQAEVAERARELIRAEPNRSGVVSKVITEDSAQIDYPQMLDGVGQKSVQLLIMHPPYFDIIKFSKDGRDLSNASSVDAFLEMISSIVERAAAVLDKGRYFALVIGDKYSKGEWIPLGFLTMNEVLKRGFSLKSIIVKNFEETSAKRNQKELWHYRALVGGFYIFKHEYVFVFKKK